MNIFNISLFGQASAKKLLYHSCFFQYFLFFGLSGFFLLPTVQTLLNPRVIHAQEKEKPPTKQEKATKDLKVKEALEAAQRLRAFQEPRLAYKRLEKALHENPYSRSLQHALAELCLREPLLLSRQQAHKLYQALLETNPEDARAHAGLGEILFLEAGAYFGQPSVQAQEAIKSLNQAASEHLQKATEYNPQLTQAFFLLGEIERTKARELNPSDPNYTAHRSIAYKAAAQYYQKTLELDANFHEVYLSYALVLMELEEPQKGLEQVQAYELLNGENYATWDLKSRLALHLDPPNFSLLTRSLWNIRKIFPSIENDLFYSLSKRIQDHENQNQKLHHIQVLRSMSQIFSHQERLQVLAPYLPNQKDKSKEHATKEDKTTNTSHQPVFPEFCYLAASSFFELAIEASDPNSRKTYYHQALELLNHPFSSSDKNQDKEDPQENQPEKESNIEEAIFSADVPDFLRLRALCQLRLGLYQEAIQDFQELALYDKEDPNALAYAAVIPDIEAGFMSLKAFENYLDILDVTMSREQRIQLLQGLLAPWPDFSAGHSTLGWLFYRTSNFEKAVDHFDTALKRKKFYKPALYGRGLSLIRLAQFEAAQASLKKVFELEPDFRDVRFWHHLLEKAYEQKVDFQAILLFQESLQDSLPLQEQIEKLDRALLLWPSFFEALIERASQALQEEDLELVTSLSQRMLASASTPQERSRAHAFRANLARRHNDNQKALEEYQLAREYEKDDLERRASLFYLESYLLFTQKSYDQSYRLLQKATQEGLQFSAFQPDQETLEQIDPQDFIAGLSQDQKIYLQPQRQSGEKKNYRIKLSVGQEGPQYIDQSIDLVASLEMLSSPEKNGLYEINVYLEKQKDADNQDPNFNVLQGLEFQLKISPWFGLVEFPFAEDDPAYAPSLPLIQGICESFTITLGFKTLEFPFLWSGSHLQGVAHLGGRHEACYLQHNDLGELHFKRLAIDDFKSADDLVDFHAARKSIETKVILNPRHALKEVTMNVRRSSLTPEEDDVITKKIGLQLQLMD